MQRISPIPTKPKNVFGFLLPIAMVLCNDLRAEAWEADIERNNNSGSNAAMRRASNILGSNVTNYQGDALGEVKDLILDMVHGDIAYVVIATGGVLGVGERWHAVPMTSLQLNRTRNGFMMNMNYDAWINAPGFDKKDWPDLGSSAWNRENDHYYREDRQ